MCKNTVAAFWGTFRAIVKKAYLDKYLRENINDYLSALKKEDVHKEYLTQEEVIKLANTPCDYPVLKQASLFSCLTGLRISDILKLTWEEIQLAPDEGYCLCFTSQKTDRDVTIPIGFQAYELLGERGVDKVFKGLKRCWTQGPLKKWVADAGITNKHITFHCFRHTYATLQIAAGTDIYTPTPLNNTNLGVEDAAIQQFNNQQSTSSLKSLLAEGISNTDNNSAIVTNQRHYEALQQIVQILPRVRESLLSNTPADLVVIDIRDALYHIGTITGEVASSEVLNNIFHRFCIGK